MSNPISWLERIAIRKGIKFIQNKIDNMKGSWKTSLVGWLAIFGALIYSILIPVFDGNPATNIDLASFLEALKQIWPAIPAGMIGILARGKEVSSEAQAEAGTKMK